MNKLKRIGLGAFIVVVGAMVLCSSPYAICKPCVEQKAIKNGQTIIPGLAAPADQFEPPAPAAPRNGSHNLVETTWDDPDWALATGDHILMAHLYTRQTDCNNNGIPDECDIDCGEPGGPCDVPGCGQSLDCDGNGIPDECDIALFVGTKSGGCGGDANVYQYVGGTKWVNLTPDHLGNASVVMDLEYFDDHLYAGVQTKLGFGGSDGEGQIWRREGGQIWTQIATLDNSVMTLEAYEGQLYAGTNAGKLYRCTVCDGSDWETIPGGGGSGFRSDIVSSVCGDPQLFLGELYTDAFWRYNTTDGLVFLDGHGGSCIWDFAEYGDDLYAGAWAGYGPIFRTVKDPDCGNPPIFEQLYTTGADNWAMATFQGKLYVGSGDGGPGDTGAKLRSYDGATWTIEHEWPTTEYTEGVSALTPYGDEYLYIGLGLPEGEYNPGDGRAEVWRFDGSTYLQISEVDYFGSAVQCMLIGGGTVDCNGNGIHDDCDISDGYSSDENANGIPDECEVDCNGNGIPDELDIASGYSQDIDGNGVPDECHGIIYVDDNCSPPGDGSELNPFCTIQDGIDAATSGDTVMVKDGTYTGTGNKDLNFGSEQINILLRSENGPENCIIDCEGSGRGFYLSGFCSHDSTIIDGFTVTDGSSGGIDCGGSDCNPLIRNCIIRNNSGNGIRCGSSNKATIDNCIISGNTASVGAGIELWWGSSPTIRNSIITANTASSSGGALYNERPGKGSLDSDKTRYSKDGKGSRDRGSSSDTMFNNCIIAGNSAGGSGGAISNYYDLKLIDTVITGNSAGNDGGGVSGSGDLNIYNCIISNNIATDQGGGIYASYATIICNSILWNDSPDEIDTYSGSPQVTYSDIEGGWSGDGNINSDPLFAAGPSGSWTVNGAYDPNTGQTTLTDGSAGWEAGALAGKLINPDTSQPLQFVVVDNTATSLTVWSDVAGIAQVSDSYQLFNYHITAGSPCIDAADNDSVPADIGDIDNDGDTSEVTPIDLDGNPRFTDDPDTTDTGNGNPPIVDMGAYEYQEEGEYCCICPGDMNGDGLVNGSDMQQFTDCMLGGSPDSEECICADMDFDGDIDGDDQSLFIARLFEPAACEPFADCNGNGIPDHCDIAQGTSADTNGNGIPDECEVIDEEPPVVSNIIPEEGLSTSNRRQPFHADMSDNVLLRSVVLSLDGEEVLHNICPMDIPSAPIDYIPAEDLSCDEHVYELSVSDTSGNDTIVTRNFTVYCLETIRRKLSLRNPFIH